MITRCFICGGDPFLKPVKFSTIVPPKTDSVLEFSRNGSKGMVAGLCTSCVEDYKRAGLISGYDVNHVDVATEPSNDDDRKLLRRCYSIYLWAYALAVSGGSVNLDIPDEAMDELGPRAVFAHQHAAALGASSGSHARVNRDGTASTYPEFVNYFKAMLVSE